MFKMQVLHNKGNPKELKSKFSDKYQMQYSQKKKNWSFCNSDATAIIHEN